MAAKTKRPDGLTAIAILWILNGIALLITGALTAKTYLPYVYSSQTLGDQYRWFQSGIMIVIVINALLIVAGILQIITAYGLSSGRNFSYKLAFIIPILIMFITGIGAIVYISAPNQFYDFSGPFQASMFYLSLGIFLIAVSCLYVTKDRAKAYLTRQATPTKAQKAYVAAKAQTGNEKSAVVERQGKFYCRYCGTQNPKDALFCESCGKKLL